MMSTRYGIVHDEVVKLLGGGQKLKIGQRGVESYLVLDAFRTDTFVSSLDELVVLPLGEVPRTTVSFRGGDVVGEYM